MLDIQTIALVQELHDANLLLGYSVEKFLENDKARIALVMHLLERKEFERLVKVFSTFCLPHESFEAVAKTITDLPTLEAYLRCFVDRYFSVRPDQLRAPYGLAVKFRNVHFLKEFYKLHLSAFPPSSNSHLGHIDLIKLAIQDQGHLIEPSNPNYLEWFAFFAEKNIMPISLQNRGHREKLQAIFPNLKPEAFLLIAGNVVQHPGDFVFMFEQLQLQPYTAAQRNDILDGLAVQLYCLMKKQSSILPLWLLTFRLHFIPMELCKLLIKSLDPVFHPFLQQVITEDHLKTLLSYMVTLEYEGPGNARQLTFLLENAETFSNAFRLQLNTALPATCTEICYSYLSLQETITDVFSTAIQHPTSTQGLSKALMLPFINKAAYLDFSQGNIPLQLMKHLVLQEDTAAFLSLLEPLLTYPSIDWAARDNTGMNVAQILLRRYNLPASMPFLERIIQIHGKKRAQETKDESLAHWGNWDPKDKAQFFGLERLHLPIINLFPGGKDVQFSYTGPTGEFNGLIPWDELPAGAQRNPQGFDYDIREYIAEKNEFFGTPPKQRSAEDQLGALRFYPCDLPRIRLFLQASPSIESVNLSTDAGLMDVSLLTCASALTLTDLYQQVRQKHMKHLMTDLYLSIHMLQREEDSLDKDFIENFFADMSSHPIPTLRHTVIQALHCAALHNKLTAFKQLIAIDASVCLEPGLYSREIDVFLIKHIDHLELPPALFIKALTSDRRNNLDNANAMCALFKHLPGLEHNFLYAFINTLPELQNSFYWKKLLTDGTKLSLDHFMNHLRGLHKAPWYQFWSPQYSGKNTAKFFAQYNRPTFDVDAQTTKINRAHLVMNMRKHLFNDMNVILKQEYKQVPHNTTEEAVPTFKDLKISLEAKSIAVNWHYKPKTCFPRESLHEHLETMRHSKPDKYQAIVKAKTKGEFEKALAKHTSFFHVGETTSTKLYYEGLTQPSTITKGELNHGR